MTFYDVKPEKLFTAADLCSEAVLFEESESRRDIRRNACVQRYLSKNLKNGRIPCIEISAQNAEDFKRLFQVMCESHMAA